LEYAKLILEYIKVLLTAPVLFSIVALIFFNLFKEDIKALILRIAKIKLPGGAEVSTPQTDQLAIEDERKEPIIKNDFAVVGLPNDLTPQQQHLVEQVIRSHIATAYVWEYRYLNYFLVRITQQVLDWLAGLPQATTYTYYDAIWLPIIPSTSERQVVIKALDAHHLIQTDTTGMISVTPKGREYLEWRGILPPPPTT